MICSTFVVTQTAKALEICGDLKQGELIVIKDTNAKSVTLYSGENIKTLSDPNYTSKNKKDYLVSGDGITLMALHRDTPSMVTIGAYPYTDAGTLYELQIEPTAWDIQKINGVAQSKVTPTGKTDLKEIERERRDLGRAITYRKSGNAWRNGFIEPIEGRISGHFGNQRIFNGVPKSPHTGVDIAAPEGTPVKASGDGIVILSGKDYFYTGNMVVIDHGQSLQTIYAHLKSAVVKEGDIVSKGDVIGYVGKTGRATGPHLHWGASLNNVRFRPHSLLDINEKRCKTIDGTYTGE
ncbi:MAG: M23 family metallopeptidase [Alphaproteobacteria bacterium]|nr:M23 family metallopeptidase [Alphaproteobacteria bacterium]